MNIYIYHTTVSYIQGWDKWLSVLCVTESLIQKQFMNSESHTALIFYFFIISLYSAIDLFRNCIIKSQYIINSNDSFINIDSFENATTK